MFKGHLTVQLNPLSLAQTNWHLCNYSWRQRDMVLLAPRSHAHFTRTPRGCRFSRRFAVVGATRPACFTVWDEIRQTRATLVFSGEATDFCGASPARVYWCVHVCTLQQGCVRVAGGPNGHSVTTDGQEKPGGHLRGHGRCGVPTVCACAHVLM